MRASEVGRRAVVLERSRAGTDVSIGLAPDYVPEFPPPCLGIWRANLSLYLSISFFLSFLLFLSLFFPLALLSFSLSLFLSFSLSLFLSFSLSLFLSRPQRDEDVNLYDGEAHQFSRFGDANVDVSVADAWLRLKVPPEELRRPCSSFDPKNERGGRSALWFLLSSIDILL